MSENSERIGVKSRSLWVALFGAVLVLLGAIQPSSAQQAPASPPAAAGAPLKVATRIVRPFVFEENGQLTGYSVELWNLIAQRIGETTTYDVQTSVADLLNAVKSGQDRIGISAITITADRERQFDFSQPMLETGLGIMTRATPSNGIFTMLAGLDWAGIGRILGIFLLLNLIPAHIIWWDQRKADQSEAAIPISPNYYPGIFESLFWCTLTWAAQADGTPTRVVSRITHTVVVWGSVILVTLMVAIISSALTVQKLNSDISGPSDLPGKQVAAVKNSTTVTYLRGIGVKAVEADDVEAAIKKLTDGEVEAVVYDMPVLQYYVAHGTSGNLRIAGDSFVKGNYGIVFSSGEPLRKSINEALLALHEDGTIARLNSKWFGDTTSAAQ